MTHFRPHVLVLLVAACGGTGPSSPARPVARPAKSRPAADAGDILVVATGTSSDRDDISLAELSRGYCAGTIAVLASARATADARFGCTARKTVDDVAAFVATPAAKRELVVVDFAHLTVQLKALSIDHHALVRDPARYPLLDGATPPKLTHFILTGVTAITRALGAAVDEHGVDWLTANLRPEFAGADYVHISNEVSIKPDCTYPTKGTYQFCTKPRDMQALIDLGANVIELTGNHIRDFGDDPFRQTLAWYAKHDMKTFGGGATPEAAAVPVLVPLAGGKQLGIAGFNEQCPLKECAKRADEPGANAYDPAKAKATIAKLREQGADFVIVTVQFREWDNPQPTKTQAAISHQLIDDGADLVYGSQAHQLQYFELYKGKPIFHGLGNLLFDQIHRIGVRQAYFTHLYFWQGRLVQSVPVFTFMADDRQPTLATPEQAAAMRAIVYRDELIYTPAR
ncbi:MAG TPA: CapA family protein [Kofleriaceae bacterium]|nr:CapA family protein [Kofleriaceae bacterium]